MRTINLQSLTDYEIKELNQISNDIKKDFNSITESIFFSSQNNNLSFFFHPLLSRNPHQSNFYLDICKIILVKNIFERGESIELIIADNQKQKKILEEITHNKIPIKFNNVGFKDSLIFKTSRDIFLIFKKIFFYIITKNINRINKIKNCKNIILIDTFIIDDSSNKYNDRYFTDILKYVSPDQIKKIFWIPSLLKNLSKNKLQSIYENSYQNILFKHDFLEFKDYYKSFIKILNCKLSIKDRFFIKKIDVTSLIEHEFIKNKFSINIFDSLLNFYFVKRFSNINNNVDLLIDWHENQNIDKSLIKGFKTFLPNTYIKGYQGYIISKDFNFYIQPTNYEIENNLLPHEICVIGKNLKKDIFKFSNNIKVKVAPSFRFQYLFNTYKRTNSSNILLVILPISKNESVDIINLLIETYDLIKNLSYKIILKPHPALNFNYIKNKYSHSSVFKLFEIKTSNFINLLIKSDILIGNTSSTLLESISFGIPVIVVGSNNNISQNPIPKNINKMIWKICYNNVEVEDTIKLYHNYNIDDKKKLIKIGNDFKENYFTKTTKLNVNQFLNLKI